MITPSTITEEYIRAQNLYIISLYDQAKAERPDLRCNEFISDHYLNSMYEFSFRGYYLGLNHKMKWQGFDQKHLHWGELDLKQHQSALEEKIK